MCTSSAYIGDLSKQFVHTLKMTSDISFVEIGKTYIALSHCWSSTCVDSDTQEKSFYF